MYYYIKIIFYYIKNNIHEEQKEGRKTLIAWSSLLLSFSTLSFWRSSLSSFPLFSRSMRSLLSRLSLSCGSSVSESGIITLRQKQLAHLIMTEPEQNTHPAFSSQYPEISFSFFSPHPPSSSFLPSPAPCALLPRLLALPWRGTWAKKKKLRTQVKWQ